MEKENLQDKEIMLVKDGLTVHRDTSGITVEYEGDLTLNFRGNLNLKVSGEVNLYSTNEVNVHSGEINVLSRGPINLDAPKTPSTNYPITLNSRLNKSIKNHPNSISFRKKQEIKSKEAFKQVNLLLLQDSIDISKVVEKA